MGLVKSKKTMNIEQIAKTCHEVNRAYCNAIENSMEQLPWEDSPDWQKQSAINGVKYHLENSEAQPSDSHENWLKEKVESGWVWGEEKDVEAKTHPCMVPYEALPLSQRVKDHLFIAVVHSLKSTLEQAGAVEQIPVTEVDLDSFLEKVKQLPKREKQLAISKLKEFLQLKEFLLKF